VDADTGMTANPQLVTSAKEFGSWYGCRRQAMGLSAISFDAGRGGRGSFFHDHRNGS